MNREELNSARAARMKKAEEENVWTLFHTNECAEITICEAVRYMTTNFKEASVDDPLVKERTAEVLRAALVMVESF